MPARGVLRRSVRRAAVAVTATCAAVALLSGPTETSGPADAEPPNLTAVPPQLPADLDGLIPAPPVAKLSRIPERSRIPGASRELQELREAIMPSPTGDPFFDVWPADLARHRPGELLAQRDVAPVAAPLLEVRVAYARQIKFRTVDAAKCSSIADEVTNASSAVDEEGWAAPTTSSPSFSVMISKESLFG